MLLHRTALSLLALSLVACAANTDSNDGESVSSTDQALAKACDDHCTSGCADEDQPPVAAQATLVSFDVSTGALTYVAGGATHTAFVTVATIARRAPLAQFHPGDPIFPIIQAWDALIASGASVFGAGAITDIATAGFRGLTAQLAADHAHLRVKLDSSGTIKALRPIP